MSSTIHVELTRGYVAVIDRSDLITIRKHHWFAVGLPGNVYAAHKGKWPEKYVKMEIELLGRRPGLLIDHRDGDPLNNRRKNLRWASVSQNAANRVFTHRRNKTGYFGVFGFRSKFRGCVGHQMKQHWTPRFDSPEDAARARDDLAFRLFGEFQIYNYPRPELPRGQTRLWAGGTS